MKEKGPCIAAGKCVGSTYRFMAEKTSKVRHFFGKIARSVAEETQIMCARIGNLFKRVKTDGQLAHWEMKQQDNFAKLGEEIFRLKGTELNNVFKDEGSKAFLDRVRQDQSQIQKIKDAIYAQKKRMEETLIFKHATDELKSPESHMRRVALRVLERLGKKKAITDIVKLLEDPDSEVRKRAREVIQKLTALSKESTPVE